MQLMQLTNNKRKWGQRVLMAGSVCFLLGIAAYWYTDGFSFPSTPVPQPQAKATPPLPSPAPQADAAKAESALVVESAQPKADAGTLHNFAAKQAQLDEVKLDVAIAEQQAKLKELRDGKQGPVPVVVSAPVQPVSSLPPLPPLSLPPLASETTGVSPSLSPVARTSGLVAIQGVDGKLSAVFATSNGKKIVRVGESIMGSKVRTINLDSVTLTSGKTLTIGD